MSDWDWIDIGRVVIMFLIIAGVIFLLSGAFVALYKSKDSVLLVEGYVESLVIERDYGSTFYYAVIDGKYFVPVSELKKVRRAFWDWILANVNPDSIFNNNVNALEKFQKDLLFPEYFLQ